jgi:hypothetical protein
MQAALEIEHLRIERDIAGKPAEKRAFMVAKFGVPKRLDAIESLFGNGNPGTSYKRFRAAYHGNDHAPANKEFLSVDHARVAGQLSSLFAFGLGDCAPRVGFVECVAKR